MKTLDHIRVRPLSEEERSRAWNDIASRLPSTSTLSPFVFPLRTAISCAAVFIFIVGTVGASDSARPGQILFPVDIAVERVESSIYPASKADHARERLAEFDQMVGSEPVQDPAPAGARMEKTIAPEADMMMFSMMADNAPPSIILSDETEKDIESTRKKLNQLLNEAVIDEDPETVAEIIMTIEEFEERVRSMRGQ